MKDISVFEILINKLVKQESLLADFYALCRKETYQYRRLWNFLIREEKRHSKILEAMIPKFQSGEIYINSDIVNLKLLDYSLDFITLKIQAVKNRKHSALELLELAHQFELCTLEAVIFESIDSEDQAVVDKMRKIHEETETHSKILKKAIKGKKNIFWKIIYLFIGLGIPKSKNLEE